MSIGFSDLIASSKVGSDSSLASEASETAASLSAAFVAVSSSAACTYWIGVEATIANDKKAAITLFKFPFISSISFFLYSVFIVANQMAGGGRPLLFLITYHSPFDFFVSVFMIFSGTDVRQTGVSRLHSLCHL